MQALQEISISASCSVRFQADSKSLPESCHEEHQNAYFLLETKLQPHDSKDRKDQDVGIRNDAPCCDRYHDVETDFAAHY